jgi:hypothetical protein
MHAPQRKKGARGSDRILTEIKSTLITFRPRDSEICYPGRMKKPKSNTKKKTMQKNISNANKNIHSSFSMLAYSSSFPKTSSFDLVYLVRTPVRH